MPIVKLKAFGIAKEIIGAGDVALEIEPGMAAGQVKLLLQNRYPEFGNLRSFALAVNGTYCENDTIIVSGDEVAIIPPVSGG